MYKDELYMEKYCCIFQKNRTLYHQNIIVFNKY